MKKTLAIIAMAFLLLSPISVNAAHTHDWGPATFSRVDYIKDNPFSSDCAVAYSYNQHTCKICGTNAVYLYKTTQMQHSFSNNKCIYCGMGLARNHK